MLRIKLRILPGRSVFMKSLSIKAKSSSLHNDQSLGTWLIEFINARFGLKTLLITFGSGISSFISSTYFNQLDNNKKRAFELNYLPGNKKVKAYSNSFSKECVSSAISTSLNGWLSWSTNLCFNTQSGLFNLVESDLVHFTFRILASLVIFLATSSCPSSSCF